MLTYNNIEEIYQALDKTRTKLVETVEILSLEESAARENVEGWSVQEIIEHLGMVEGGIARIIEKLISKAEVKGGSFNGEFEPPLSLEELVPPEMRGQKFEAPDFAHPQGKQNIEQSLAILAKTRMELKKLRSRIEVVDSSGERFPHPVFGLLNPYEWLAVINLHEFKHLLQIKRILKLN